jgi:hypothetical protein
MGLLQCHGVFLFAKDPRTIWLRFVVLTVQALLPSLFVSFARSWDATTPVDQICTLQTLASIIGEIVEQMHFFIRKANGAD